MRDKASEASDDVKEKVDQQIAELKLKWDELAVRRDRIADAADEKRELLQDEAEAKWAEVKVGVKDSIDRIKLNSVELSIAARPAARRVLPRLAALDRTRQRQDFVRIVLEDGAEYALEPVGSQPGNFRDTVRNVPVYRKSGLGDKGVIFDFPTETISVHY